MPTPFDPRAKENQWPLVRLDEWNGPGDHGGMRTQGTGTPKGSNIKKHCVQWPGENNAGAKKEGSESLRLKKAPVKKRFGEDAPSTRGTQREVRGD